MTAIVIINRQHCMQCTDGGEHPPCQISPHLCNVLCVAPAGRKTSKLALSNLNNRRFALCAMLLVNNDISGH